MNLTTIVERYNIDLKFSAICPISHQPDGSEIMAYCTRHNTEMICRFKQHIGESGRSTGTNSLYIMTKSGGILLHRTIYDSQEVVAWLPSCDHEIIKNLARLKRSAQKRAQNKLAKQHVSLSDIVEACLTDEKIGYSKFSLAYHNNMTLKVVRLWTPICFLNIICGNNLHIAFGRISDGKWHKPANDIADPDNKAIVSIIALYRTMMNCMSNFNIANQVDNP